MAIYPLFATTISLSVLPVFTKQNFLSVLENPTSNFIIKDETCKKFKQFSLELYIPTLQFLLDNHINANLVITGYFLEMSQKHSPKIIEIIKTLVELKLVKIVANSFAGESLSVLYNSSWWFESIKKTIKSCKEILQIDLKVVYLEQIYKNLELENLVGQTSVQTFILRQASKKHLSFHLKLSDFRRFNKEEVFWINEQNNKDCKFYFVPNDYFFDLNGNLFQPDLPQAMRTCRMAIGYHANEYTIKKQTNRARQSHQIPRINDKPTLSAFNVLEKGIMRFWEYGSVLIASSHKLNPSEITEELFWQFSLLQTRDFCYFLNKKLYFNGNVNNFSSPFEALINFQGIIKSTKILLGKNL